MRIPIAVLLVVTACSSPKTGDYVYDLGGAGPGPGRSGSGGGATDASGGTANGATSAGSASTPSPGTTSPAPSDSGSFDVTLDRSSANLDLMTSGKVVMTVAPSGGFGGTVTLSASGMPPDVALTFDKATVDLASGPTVVTATITVASRALPGASALTVTASTAGRPPIAKPVALTVNARLDVTITESAISPSPVTLTLGSGPIAVRVHNADGVAHQIHADDAQRGFAHGNDIDPGADEGNTQAGEPRTVKAKGTYDYYLHDNTLVRGKIVVQ